MPTDDAAGLIAKTVEHRKKRIEQVLEGLSKGPGEVGELAGKIYRNEADPRLKPLYERTTRAALEYLVEQGRARKLEEDRYEITPAAS
jgi:hypothetical protein